MKGIELVGRCKKPTPFDLRTLPDSVHDLAANGRSFPADVRHHTCLASRISMASTHESLRQRAALRSATVQLPAHSAWLQAAMPLGQRLLGGCGAKWITRQCE